MLCRECNQAEATKKYDLCAGCYFKPAVHKKHRLAAKQDQATGQPESSRELSRVLEVEPETTATSPAATAASDDNGRPNHPATGRADCDEYQYGYGTDLKCYNDYSVYQDAMASFAAADLFSATTIVAAASVADQAVADDNRSDDQAVRQRAVGEYGGSLPDWHESRDGTKIAGEPESAPAAADPGSAGGSVHHWLLDDRQPDVAADPGSAGGSVHHWLLDDRQPDVAADPGNGEQDPAPPDGDPAAPNGGCTGRSDAIGDWHPLAIVGSIDPKDYSIALQPAFTHNNRHYRVAPAVATAAGVRDLVARYRQHLVVYRAIKLPVVPVHYKIHYAVVPDIDVDAWDEDHGWPHGPPR